MKENGIDFGMKMELIKWMMKENIIECVNQNGID